MYVCARVHVLVCVGGGGGGGEVHTCKCMCRSNATVFQGIVQFIFCSVHCVLLQLLCRTFSTEISPDQGTKMGNKIVPGELIATANIHSLFYYSIVRSICRTPIFGHDIQISILFK